MPYHSVLLHEGLSIVLIFLDDKMNSLRYFFAVDPSYQAPSDFGEYRMITIPSLKIDSAPNTHFLGPECTNTFKQVTPRSKSRIGSFEQTLVVLVDFLKGPPVVRLNVCPCGVKPVSAPL